MELLDLPPELLERVMVLYVKKYGIVEAWKIRKICKTFSIHIDRVIFAEQPISAFLRTKEHNARAILKNNLVSYLIHHTNNLAGAHKFLPDFLNGMLEGLLEGLANNEKKNMKRTAYLRLLCELLVKRSGDTVWSFVTMTSAASTNKMSSIKFAKSIEISKVAAAAAVGSLDALRRGLQNDRQRLWEESDAFGYPLTLAAEGNHVEIVQAIVKSFEEYQHKYPASMPKPYFMLAIDAAMTERFIGIAALLLKIYHKYFPVLPQRYFDTWLAQAILTGNHDLIRSVKALKTVGGTAGYVMGFRMACEQGDAQIARMFIDDGHLDINQGLPYDTFPLEIAFNTGHANVVELLLRLGADPDGPHKRWPHARLLWTAIAENKDQMVKLLLDWGANPHLVQGDGDKTSRRFKTGCSAIAIAESIKEAKQKVDYFADRYVQRTNFATDAEVL
ncbi:ankyrin [Clathrospora elynae]|uniref:Ankyrin n=1 Tax=Clathrospora elynae TaxID=706981 RepID=A0A6A5S552_9PLEO|nr:ankyrin [Clathrospora elynae]